MLPDPEALIRRSGAAAPLLNAVRERRARDGATGNSVIDRILGIPPHRPPAAPRRPSSPRRRLKSRNRPVLAGAAGARLRLSLANARIT